MRSFTVALLLLFCSGMCAAATPELIIHIAAQGSFVRGSERLYPVELNANAAQDALTGGGMWLTAPDGARTFARTERVDPQRDGNQTWIGKVSTPGGERSVVITFGRDATFGSLLSATGKPFRVTTRGGKTYLVQADAAAGHAPALKLRPPAPDYVIPPHQRAKSGRAMAQPSAAAWATASSTTPTTVDLLLGYTSGVVSQLGSTSAVITNLTYLVAVANQAYADSQVNGRVRLVGTLEVNYSDIPTNHQALDDLTPGANAAGAYADALAPLIAKRRDLGADLVSLVRPFALVTQDGSCGVGWMPGGSLQPYLSDDAGWGYSVINIGTWENGTSSYFCADVTLAHEIGHNLGLAHDKADAAGPGAFTYAYGWQQTFPVGSFYTIMAYGAAGQEPVPYFANPDITLCNNHPCGDPIEANQTLALNQTMPVAAKFNAPGGPLLDLNGDGLTDLVLQKNAGGQFTYMLEGGAFFPSFYKTQPVASGYRIAAIGDLYGDRRSELVWTSAANDVYFWTYNGAGGFSSVRGPDHAAGWKLIGTGDMNGDGTSDLLWTNASAHQFGYWLMNGTAVVGKRTISVAPGYYIAAIGDFAGLGRADLVWTSAANDLYFWMNNGNGTFTSRRGLDYPSGWQLQGSGDMDGDQRADLVWTNDTTHQFAYWLMSGSTRVGYKIVPIAAGYHVVNIDRFAGAVAGILWTSAANDLYLWTNNGDGTFSSSQVVGGEPAGGGAYYNNYPNGWSVLSTLPAKP
jgi:hypothetical protein